MKKSLFLAVYLISFSFLVHAGEAGSKLVVSKAERKQQDLELARLAEEYRKDHPCVPKSLVLPAVRLLRKDAVPELAKIEQDEGLVRLTPAEERDILMAARKEKLRTGSLLGNDRSRRSSLCSVTGSDGSTSSGSASPSSPRAPHPKVASEEITD